MSSATTFIMDCQDQYGELVFWAECFIKLAWWAALIVLFAVGVAAIVKFVKDWQDPAKKLVDGAGSTLLDSLKGLIDSLKTAPAWFAIFLAGLALLWAADRSASNCAAINDKLIASRPQGGGSPQGGSSTAHAQAAGGGSSNAQGARH